MVNPTTPLPTPGDGQQNSGSNSQTNSGSQSQNSTANPGSVPQPTQSLAEVMYGNMIPEDNSQVPASILGIYSNSGLLHNTGPFPETPSGKPILPDYVNYTPMYGSGAFTPQLGNMYQNYWTSIFYPRQQS